MGPVTTIPSERRAHLVVLAGQLFAEKGFRATTVRDIAQAAGILSGSLYHHFDSKESIGDEILASFLNAVLADYRRAVAEGSDPRDVLERVVRSTVDTLTHHRAALMMLQNDWSYFRSQPRFGYLREALGEIERVWVEQLEKGVRQGAFRQWTPEQVTEGFLKLVFNGIIS
jgi:TetR/AcrR family transcriptional regulator, cholesterol catabolism regulator